MRRRAPLNPECGCRAAVRDEHGFDGASGAGSDVPPRLDAALPGGAEHLVRRGIQPFADEIRVSWLVAPKSKSRQLVTSDSSCGNDAATRWRSRPRDLFAEGTEDGKTLRVVLLAEEGSERGSQFGVVILGDLRPAVLFAFSARWPRSRSGRECRPSGTRRAGVGVGGGRRPRDEGRPRARRGSRRDLDRVDDLPRSVVEVVGADHVKARHRR